MLILNLRCRCQSTPLLSGRRWLFPGMSRQPPLRTHMSTSVPVSLLVGVVVLGLHRVADITQAALRLELAEQDAADIRSGKVTSVHEYYSSSTIIIVGMEIEDQQ